MLYEYIQPDPSCFNPCFDGFCIATFLFYHKVVNELSFNPCFDGFCIATESIDEETAQIMGFNPCFDGFCIATFKWNTISFIIYTVSILVLMDFALRLL